jgi:hypothetical protein
MLIKTITDEDFVNYCKPSMFIGMCYCNWKCCVENNLPVTTCQNEPLAQQPNIEVPIDFIFNRYIKNPITSAIVIAGLEPFLQFEEVYQLIEYFRNHNCNDDIVIYTGYYPNEIQDNITKLGQHENIIVKFGRFIPNDESKYDDVLGINLASKNQYAERIS